MVSERLAAGRDALAIPRPLFFECGGFAQASGDAAFGWRLGDRLRSLGYRPRELAATVPPGGSLAG